MMSGFDDGGIVVELERAGVARVTLISGSSVPTAGPDNAVAAYQRASERLLEESTLSWSFLRPNSFMSNALKWVGPIAAGPSSSRSPTYRSPATTRSTWPRSRWRR
jgi:hypothetical protein